MGFMKEVYWEIKINKPGPRFLPELSLSGPAKVVYFDLPIYFLHDGVTQFSCLLAIAGRPTQIIVTLRSAVCGFICCQRKYNIDLVQNDCSHVTIYVLTGTTSRSSAMLLVSR